MRPGRAVVASASESEGYTPAVWTGLFGLALATPAGLCYPRRPRTAGMLWIMLGMLSLANSVQRNPDNWLAPPGGLFMLGLGVWYPIEYSSPDVRAKHVEYWTAKA
jgi:hypothetical protein